MDEDAVTADLEVQERAGVLHELEERLEIPMIALGFVWLVLVIVELVWGSTWLLELFGGIIWILFAIEFFVRLILAPHKWLFLRNNWLTAISLVIPAFRLVRGLKVLRILRLTRTARGLKLVRVVGAFNRTMNSLQVSLARRGFIYVVGLTIAVCMLGAAGMLAFEPAAESTGGFSNYAEAVWWTAMLLTSMGTEFWPKSLEGRILCFLLALYGFGVFGYITASFASFFLGKDVTRTGEGDVSKADLLAVREEIQYLKLQITPSPDRQHNR